MSLETWKKKYYPETASYFDNLAPSERNICAALVHSLNKWRGLRPANLKRHGVSKEPNKACISDGSNKLIIDWGSCALCSIYENGNCAGCPIKEVTNRCRDHQYYMFVKNADPKAMISCLIAALRKIGTTWVRFPQRSLLIS